MVGTSSTAVRSRLPDADPQMAAVQDGRPGGIDVVIVSYRSADMVLHCLECLPAAAAGVEITVTVVDNGSGDGILDALAVVEDIGYEIRTVDMGYNSGFSVANNRGIAAGNRPYVLILNPDTTARDGALSTLLEFAAGHPGAGVIAPALLNADGTDQRTARSFPTAAAAIFGRRSVLTRLFPDNRWSRKFLSGRDHPADRPFRIDWVSGAAMLIPRAVLDEVGAFDEEFFLFWEDADLCRRIGDAGHSVWCVPAAQVVHDEGGTRDHGWQPATLRWFHDGAYRYWRKHHAPQWWNPLRWAAFGLLRGRAALLIGQSRLRTAAAGRTPAR